VTRQTWVLLGIVAFVGVVGIAVWNFDLTSATPPVSRTPAVSFPVTTRDTSAPAARGKAANADTGAPAPKAPRPPRAPAVPEPTPEPVAAVPTTATLRITTDVSGAQVFIDRKYIGVAPVTAEDITPGSRTINVSAPGYDGVAETLEVTPGARGVMISLKTIRLEASIPVTHKHGMGGSCAGRLLATPEGLRYETDNKKDGFSAPLTDLETFKVDFIAKNLKVKIKGGRSYDFTDPDGKADPLYLFHQAVEKARARQVSK
jgi:hypothetical protein